MKKLTILFTTCAMITALTITASSFQLQQMKHWEAPKSANLIKNPLKGNAAATIKGKALFESQCIMCHGSKGKGNGSAAADLQPRPADLTAKMTQSHTDGALYWKIMTGNTPMPSFKEAHKVDHNQCWQVINYIRELGKQPGK